MKAYTLKKKDIKILLNRCLQDYKVYGPIRPGLDSTFDEIKSINDLHLEYESTVLPIKKFFLPPKEILFTFEIKNGKILLKKINSMIKFYYLEFTHAMSMLY